MGTSNSTDGFCAESKTNHSPNIEAPPQLRTGTASDVQHLRALLQNAVTRESLNPAFFIKWPLNVTVLSRLDPTRWREILLLRSRDGIVEGKDIEKLLHLVKQLKMMLPNQEEFDQTKHELATEGIFTLEEWLDDLEEQRQGLIAFLEQAFEIGC